MQMRLADRLQDQAVGKRMLFEVVCAAQADQTLADAHKTRRRYSDGTPVRPADVDLLDRQTALYMGKCWGLLPKTSPASGGSLRF